MRILIDLQGAQSTSRHRGIGRYTLSLAQAMVRNRGEHEIFLLLNGMLSDSVRSIRNKFKHLLPQVNIHVWHALAPASAMDSANSARREIAGLIRCDAIQHIQPDVVHITSLYDGFGDDAVHGIDGKRKYPVAVTFYDAIPLIHSAQYLDPDIVYREHYLECTEQIKAADLLLSISESARQEAISVLKVSSANVINISSAVDDIFRPAKYSQEQTRDLNNRFGINKPYVMYSGATDERKNHRGLIKAFSLLTPRLRETNQLVLAGKLPLEHRYQFEAFAKECGLTQFDIVITGQISDAEMVQLYNQCELYVFPSLHEGFGLPILEAMACGAAVIGSNTSSIPEVIGFDAALFDPSDPVSISSKIEQVLTNSVFREQLRVHAKTQTVQFSWDISAKIAIKALEDLNLCKRGGESPALNLLGAIANIAKKNEALDLLALSQAISRNSSNAKKQLLVDVSELVQRDARTGIQRVVRSVLREWLTCSSDEYEVRPVYATADAIGYFYANRFMCDFLNKAQLDIRDDPIDFEAGDCFVALDMQHHVQLFQAPFYQSLRDSGVNVKFVVYDILPIIFPSYFPLGAESLHIEWIRMAASSDGIIAISKSVANEVSLWLEKEADVIGTPKIEWFHLGADIENSAPSKGIPTSASDVLEEISARPTFLMVGTVEPRKGHADVLEAIDQLWATGLDINLVIVGKQGWAVDELVNRIRKHAMLDKRLFWLNEASDEFLELIYKNSTCLIAASFGEGFGLPLIETAQHQLSIIARDIPVFREIAENSAFFFQGENKTSLAKAITEWLSLYSAGKHPNSKHMRWQSWRQSAVQLRELVSEAA